MPKHLNRREFLQHSAAASASVAAVGYFTSRAAAESKSPNEKLNIACVGTANRAGANVSGVSGENLVALCDIDDNYLDAALKQFPRAKRYNDFRKMLENEQKHIDAVVVSTADHVHAPASVMAMRLGKHVYCEKPLTHTVAEARLCAKLAKENKLATQMGTQIHAEDNYRRVVEKVQAGMIGPVREVHCWVGSQWGGGDRPAGSSPVPKSLHWDLWLGPAPKRPYYEGVYHPRNWRKWWDFGGGTIGDMACHLTDLPFWALGLRHPKTVAAVGDAVHPETCPINLEVHYEYPARGKQPPVKLIWHQGNKIPEKIKGHPIPRGIGVMFLGDEGELFSDYGRHKLYPESKFSGAPAPEKTIPKSVGHHQEWINACKTGSPTTCNFDYSGAITEAVLLGNVAFRAGKKLAWDPVAFKATNCPEADRYLEKEYRKGWEL